MALMRALAMRSVAVLLIAVAAAAPQVDYPLNSQFPPVARVGEAYRFQFASTTFQPNPDKLQYSLIGNPSWLHVISDNRTLWGTPAASDTGTITFTIAAAGEAGAVVNMESKLLVTNDDGVKINGNISQQLSKASQLSGPNSVTLLPSKPFEVEFALDTFQANGKSLSYHATLTDHTPLPAWISFDAQSLHFAGTTPGVESPQSFEILLIASDTPNFTTASVQFTLIVSNHQLLFKPLNLAINMSKGDQVDITDVKSTLFLDNVPIRDEDIQSANAELPNWLSFDDHTFDITGSPPSGIMSQDVTVTVHDKYGDIAKHSIHLTFTSQLFTVEIEQLNITAGAPFEYEIPKSLFSQDDENISMDLSDLGQWLSFDPNALTIHGTVPKDFASRSIEGTMTATSHDGKLKDSQTFALQVAAANTQSDSGGKTTTTSPEQPNKDSGASNVHSGSAENKRAGVIVGSAVSALFAAVILGIFFCFLCRRKNKTKGYVSPKAPISPRKMDISRPIPIAEEWGEIDRAHDVDLEKGKEDDDTLERTPEHPPQLNLNLSLKRKGSHSPVSSIDEPEDKILSEFNSSPWGLDEAGPSHHPHDSMKIPTEMARRESASSPLKHKRRTTQIYRDTPRHSAGLPLNRRLSGLGHGRHTYSPSRSINNYSALRRRLSSSSYTTATHSLSMASTTPTACPQPPKARHTTQLTTGIENRRSIRVVPSSTCDSLLDARTMDEKRNSYIRKRASAKAEKGGLEDMAQSPFFAAGPARLSSASYKASPEPKPAARSVLTPLSTNIVKPSDEVVRDKPAEREKPDSLRIRKPAETPSPVIENTKYPGSLRKHRPTRAFTRRHTENVPTANRDRVEKSYVRPGTTVYSRTSVGRRPSSRQSFRAAELKSSLNSLTGSKIFEDAELSESVYSTEEEDIEEYERRTTIKANQFTLPPLNLNAKDKRNSKRDSKRNSKREMKRTNQRDPTPYSLALEHGGKENHSSTYSLDKTAAAALASSRAKGKAKATTSPDRPKTSFGRRPLHARTQSRTAHRSSSQRDSQGRPLSRVPSTKERHSRKSIHSRQQSRLSQSAPKRPRDRSRTQSSAYPFFDASSLLTEAGKTSNDTATGTTRPRKDTDVSMRDNSGNIINYALHEDPKIEELSRNSIGFRTSNGRVNSTARNSKLAQLQLQSNPFYHSKRDTAVARPSSPTLPEQESIGLGLSLQKTAEDVPGLVNTGRGRERTPLSVLGDGNGEDSPEWGRMVEGKGKRPISIEVEEDQTGTGKGRKTWGSLRGVLGRSGGNLWGSREQKAFI